MVHCRPFCHGCSSFVHTIFILGLSNPSLAKIEGEVLDIIVLAFPSSLASCWSHFLVPSKPSLTRMQGEVFFPLLQLCPERREEREGLVGVVFLETRTNLNWLDLILDILFRECCLSLARIHTVTSAVNSARAREATPNSGEHHLPQKSLRSRWSVNENL